MGRPFVVLATTTTTTTNTTIHYTAHPRFQGAIYFGEQAGMVIRESATLNVHRPTMSSESWAKLRWQYVIMQQHQELSRGSGP
ncbi:unnamed protein product [Sphagnum troendelagicum]